MIFYNSEESASEVMSNAGPEQVKASMDEWLKWRDEVSKNFKVDFGLPLQVVKRVTAEGITEGDNPVSGYSIVEGESKEALLELLKTHPHLKRPGTSIDVFEMLPIPGM